MARHTPTCPKCETPWNRAFTVGCSAPCPGCGTVLVVRLDLVLA